MNISKYNNKIVNIILFLYPVELFELVHNDGILGSYSPFRIIILPLCIFYILNNVFHNRSNKNNYVFPITLYFIFGIFGVLTTGTSTNLFSFLGNIIQFYVAYSIFSKSNISKSTLYVITTWSLIQIPFLIESIKNGLVGITNRFIGAFFDPNYLCAFCIPSIIAAYVLTKHSNNLLIKIYLLGVILSSLVMVFLSFSRGGMFTLLFFLFIFLLVKNKKLLIGISIIMFPVISYMLIRAQYITWLDGADNPLDGFIYRTITLSDDASALTANRSDFFYIFLENIDSYMFIGMDLHTYFNKFNGGEFIHNGIAELMIQSGIIIGLVYIFSFIHANITILIRFYRNKRIPVEYFIFASSLLCLTALSYSSKYAWLCMGIIFALTNRKDEGKYHL